MPGPTIGNNFIFPSECSHLSKLSSHRINLTFLGKAEFEGTGEDRERFDDIEIGENVPCANVSYLSDHGFIRF